MREFSGTWQSISSTAEHSPSLAATTSAANLGSLKRQPVRPPPFRDLKQRAQQMDTLALGFIQTVGYLTVDKNWMKLPAEVEETKRMFNADVGGASLRAVYDLLSADSKAVPVFITPPEVLFGSMKLAFGEQKSCKSSYLNIICLKYRVVNYEVLLPDYLPPTHRGRAMKISYKVIIGIQVC
jgi:hypothetical protein